MVPPGGFGAAVARESSTSTAETPADTSDTAPARTHRRLPSGEVLCDPLGVPTDEAPRRLGPLEEAWRFIQGQPRPGPGPARDPDHGASPGPPDPPDASERRIRAPSAVVMTDEHGRVAPVPSDFHLDDDAGGAAAPAAATIHAHATHARTLSAASYHSRGSGGSVDVGDCDLGDLGDLLRLGDSSDSDLDGAPGPSRLRVSSTSDATSTPRAVSPTPASPASASRAAAADAAKAAAKAAASAPQSEAARKTAIRKTSGGWLDGQRALYKVMKLLIREMKPLGMEGMATFDPLSGIMLWREQRLAAAARKRAIAELYPEGDALGGENPPDLRGLRLGARHAAAAYGSLAAILQNNSMQDKAHGFVGAVQAAFVSGDGDAAATKATVAAAKAAGVAPEDIVSADWVTLPILPGVVRRRRPRRENRGVGHPRDGQHVRSSHRRVQHVGPVSGRVGARGDGRIRVPGGQDATSCRDASARGEFGIRVSHHGTLHGRGRGGHLSDVAALGGRGRPRGDARGFGGGALRGRLARRGRGGGDDGDARGVPPIRRAVRV